MHGPESLPTAEHHARHLAEFATREQIAQFGHGAEALTDSHSMAYLIVEEKDMRTVRDALRPARAVVAEID